VTAWRKKDQLLGKILPYGAWLLKSRLRVGKDETLSRQRQLESILRSSDTATLNHLQSLKAELEQCFPIERLLDGIRNARRERRDSEEKLSLWSELQVAVLGRMAAALYALCLVLFVTRAVHALDAAASDAREWESHAALCLSPNGDTLLARRLKEFDVDFICNLARRCCDEALKEEGVGMSTCLTSDKVGRLLNDARRRAEEVLLGKTGILDHMALHEVVLGKEEGEEPWLVQQLRDLLSAGESVRVLRGMLDVVFHVALQHCDAATRQSNSRASCPNGCPIDATPAVKVFPKLYPELDRVCEANNEFLLSLRGEEEDSESDSFFLSLFQLQLRGKPYASEKL